MRLPSPSENLLRDLARELDAYLRQSETSRPEPWQLEIRDYLRSGRMPTLFARDNLAIWGRQKGLVRQAPTHPSHWATTQPSTPQKAGRARSSRRPAKPV